MSHSRRSLISNKILERLPVTITDFPLGRKDFVIHIQLTDNTLMDRKLMPPSLPSTVEGLNFAFIDVIISLFCYYLSDSTESPPITFFGTIPVG